MITSLSDFISESLAEREGDAWTVYCDGTNRIGAILNCKGNTEYEAKENAWEFYKELATEVEKRRD